MVLNLCGVGNFFNVSGQFNDVYFVKKNGYGKDHFFLKSLNH